MHNDNLLRSKDNGALSVEEKVNLVYNKLMIGFDILARLKKRKGRAKLVSYLNIWKVEAHFNLAKQ